MPGTEHAARLSGGAVGDGERRAIVDSVRDDDPLEDYLRMFEAFRGVMDRDGIRDQLRRKYARLLEKFQRELDDVRLHVLTFRDHPPLYDNLPPVAGAIQWARSLSERVTRPFEKIKSVRARSNRGSR